MIDPQSLIRFENFDIDAIELQGLDLLIGLRGHADAGHALAQVRTELLDSLNPRLIASFDADQLVNYRERRPQISFLGDHFAAYQGPSIELYLLTDGLDRDFLFLSGPEPDLAWDRFTRSVIALINAFNVQLTVSFDAVPMPVPHTRPLGITAHGNRKDLIEGISTWSPTAEIPASLTALLEVRLIESGRDAVGYSIHVPHYLSEAEYPQVAVGILEHIGAAMELGLPTDRLREAGRDIESQIAEQVAATPDVARMVENFEKRFDKHVPEIERRSLLVTVDAELPDGDEIALAAEEFLSGFPDSGGTAAKEK
ncbi:proteasome assembly chaperone family protein [Paeniglutamicibacter gangotriensis]|uniref:PAC2 family protein n=1 Tax=Paeniglutamicibacter gangotriensis Lz1y TaxID=1276920 RepID=M7NHL2_9MICC|nr:PAC2 family protein [Paeniglutamicibacter gangotriensis]EMQ98028.1 PAC2 family protein [Paeniglutamicibacter gangotriensis Lz1y]